ncbi:MAG: DUF721 domain-containing protein [Alphaproteobacteria bacterium]|nr:DUF721 domain-containing protein [Alphaproteobacteria bacterium]
MSAKKININISEDRHCNEFESIGSIFRPIIKDALASDDLIEVDVMLNWVDIVGENISAYSRPIKAIYDHKNDTRTLSIDVPVGGFALEIQHKEQYILGKINSYFGYRAIHKLKINQNINMKPSFINTIISNKKERDLHEDEKKYLKELTEGIEDEKIKEILIKIGKNVILSKKEEQ